LQVKNSKKSRILKKNIFFTKNKYPKFSDKTSKIDYYFGRMKRPSTKRQKFRQILDIILLSIAVILFIIVIIGTIYAFTRTSNAKPFQPEKPDITENPAYSESIFNEVSNNIRVFSGIGQLRIQLSNSSIMILSIAFPYNSGDIAFTEELASKIGEFKEITIEYFSSLPEDKIDNITQFDEESAKIEILGKFNASLRLGRIENLYFSELLIIDGS
jgi:flagellar basal body-associated protein FliL